MGNIIIKEQVAPSTPAADYHALYIDSADGKLKKKDDTGTVVEVGAAPPVTSVFGRTGAVVAVPGDYTAADVGADASGSAAAAQAFAIQRANHTGTQLASTVSDFTAAAKAAAVADAITDAVTDVAPSQNAVFDALTGKWSKAGDAGTGGTGILGTTDAQPFSIRANNLPILTFGATNPTVSSSISQAPADGIGINQFDFRVFIDPTVSTTNASHTGTFSQLVYDNGNAGFDSTGGAYLAHAANFTNNGSGDLGFASIYSGSASFNNGGTTGQFKGIASENTIASGATVSDYYGMVSGMNTTGGIVPASNAVSLYGNFTDATIGNAFALNSNLSFSGTTANSQGVNGLNTFIQFNDSTTTTNGINGLNAGIDINDTSALTGINGSNVYVNARDSATHGGLNLYSAGLNQEGSAVNPGGVIGFNANLQFFDTSDTAGVSIFNGYVNTDDTAHLDSLTGINFNPEIQGTSDVDNVTLGAFSAQIRGNSTVDNLTGVSINPQMSDSATVTNFTGLQVNPQVNGTSTLTNSLTAVQVNPQGTVPLTGAMGVNIDMSGVALTSGAVAAGAQKTGLNISDGAINAGLNYHIPSASSFFQNHYIGGAVIVDSGTPVSAFGFGTNLAQSLQADDDWTLDGSGLGFVNVGFVGALTVAATKTVARWTGALGGAGNPAGAGTITDAIMFRGAGILPQGGSLTVTNMYGFQVDPNLFGLVGTNCWGFYEDTAVAENHLSKLAIGTSTKKVANTSVALEIGNSKQLVVGRGTTAVKNALTAVEGATFYDTDLNAFQYYNGTAWVNPAGGTYIQEAPSGAIPGDTFTLSQTPISAANVMFFINGNFQLQGVGYTISGTTITTTATLTTGETVEAFYIY